MIAIIQLILPVIVILAFIVFKLNHEQKRWFFKVPIVLSSTVLSYTIGKLAHGVMSIYGGFICELFLYPAMVLIKKAWQKMDERKQRQETRAPVKAYPLALQPAFA